DGRRCRECHGWICKVFLSFGRPTAHPWGPASSTSLTVVAAGQDLNIQRSFGGLPSFSETPFVQLSEVRGPDRSGENSGGAELCLYPARMPSMPLAAPEAESEKRHLARNSPCLSREPSWPGMEST